MSNFKPFNLAPKSSREFASFRAAIVNDLPIETEPARRGEPAFPSQHVHEAPAAKSSAAPRVTVRREGDRITHIQVECGCGQMIELECAY
jgi:hypothetical protein